MKEVLSYIAFDDHIFYDKEACQVYEASALMVYRDVMVYMRDIGKGMIVFLNLAEDVLDRKIEGRDKYVEIFKGHKPCSVHCSLYKIFSDYCHDFPYLFDMYMTLITMYAEKFPER